MQDQQTKLLIENINLTDQIQYILLINSIKKK